MVTSLTIGVGGNVATFTLLDRVLFQSPPGVRDASLVRRLYIEQPEAGGLPYITEFSFPALQELAAESGEHARIEGYERRFDRSVEGVSSGVHVAYVSTGYFDLLGIRPESGRFFVADENAPANAGARVAVVSHDLWQRLAGSAADIRGDDAPLVAGHYVRIDSVPHLIVGVAQRGFDGTDLEPVGIWVPLAARPPFDEPLPLLERSTHSIELLLRLTKGTDPREIEVRLSAVYERNNRSADPWFDSFGRIVTAPLLKARGPYLFGLHDRDNMLLAKRLAAVGLVVLLVTVINVASLLLLRTIRRRHETAVRIALGASPSRLAAQLLSETWVLVLAAAALSALAGWWSGTLLRHALVFNPRWVTTPFPERAVMLAAALAMLSAFAGAFVPTLFSVCVNTLHALRINAHGGDYLGPRFRAVVLATQTALGLSLLVCGGLFLESLRRNAQLEPGIDVERLVTVNASGRRLSEGVAAETMAAIGRVAGVADVSNAASDISAGQTIAAVPAGEEFRPATRPTRANFVDHRYFESAGITVLRGRGIQHSDIRGSERVVLVSESMAAHFWPGRNPIGQCLVPVMTRTCLRVVGVFRDVRWGNRMQPAVDYYLPLAQSGSTQGHHFVVRTREEASPAIVARIQGVVDPLMSRDGRPPRVQRASSRLEALIRPWRAAAFLFAIYGVLALVSTAFGLYGSIHFDVSQRTHELGIRMALGAHHGHIIRAVVASATRSLTVGLAIGLVLILIGGRAIEPLLYETNRLSLTVLIPAVSVMIATALIAAAVPVRRLMRIDPAIALRAE